jgi:photosystem II stability/assembly factor-like uncharacterized protein
LLTGRAPLVGESPTATLLLQQQAEPKPVTELRPDVPAGLASVLARMLAKRPQDRFQTPKEIVAALAPFVDAGKTDVQRPVDSPVLAPDRQQRRRRSLLIAGAVAALFFIAFGIWSHMHRGPDTTPDNPAPPDKKDGVTIKPGNKKNGVDADTKKPAITASAIKNGKWTVLDSGVNDRLNAVAFVDDQVGLAVGEHNTIVRTTDGGKTWRRVLERKQNGSNLTQVLITGPKEAWAIGFAGSALLHSSDAGDTWEQIKTPDVGPFGIGGISLAAADKSIFLLGDHRLLFRTDDGGKNWIRLNFPGMRTYWYSSNFIFFDAKHGFFTTRGGQVNGDLFFCTTEDGGRNWQVRKMERTDRRSWAQGVTVRFADKDHGWFIPHYSGTIHATTDGGKTWTPQELGDENKNVSIDHLTVVDKHTVFVRVSGGEVRATIDGGKSWHLLSAAQVSRNIRGMSFPSAGRGFLVGDDGYVERFDAAKE